MGGGLKHISPSSTLLSLSSSSFSSCNCQMNGKGGGVYLDLSSQTSSDFSLKWLEFNGNGEGNNGIQGKDVFVACSSFSSFSSLINSSSFSFAFSISDKENSMKGGYLSSPSPFDLFFFIIGYHLSPFSLSPSNSGDQLYCGFIDFPCLSLSSLLSNKNFNPSIPNHLILEDGNYQQNQLNVGEKEFKYEGQTPSGTKITFISSSSELFLISGGTLTFLSLSLLLSSSHSSSVITVGKGGKLHIQSITIKPSSSSTSLSSSLISFNGGEMIIDSSSIGPFVMNEGDGCGIRGNVGEGGGMMLS
jgi:hypothetical protein